MIGTEDDTGPVPVLRPAPASVPVPPPPPPPPPQVPAARRDGGRHAAARPPGGRGGRRMVAAGVAVAAVGAGILAMNVAAGDSPPATSGPTVGGDAAPVPVVTPSVRPSASAATSAPTATTATTATTAPAGAPAAAPAATSAPAAPVSSVTVLNATSIRGLAARQAGVIEAAGWPVRRVTGVRARVGATTVYYDPAQRSQATALVSAVPSITRALPRPRWLLPTGGLIVVVARDAA